MTAGPRMRISPTSPWATSLPSSSTSLHLDAGDRDADRAGLALAVGRLNERDRARLGQPVALEHLAAERLLEAAQHLDRHRRAAGDAELEAEASNWSRSGWCSSAAYIVGTPRNVVDPVALDDLERLARGRSAAAASGSAPTAHARVEPAGEAEHVEQREAAEGDAVRPGVDEVDGDLRGRAQVAVGQLRALRRARRARRVEDQRRCRRPRGRRRRVDRLGRADLLLEPARLDERCTPRPRPRRPARRPRRTGARPPAACAPESSRWKPTSRPLSSGFIGTTTAPSRSAP